MFILKAQIFQNVEQVCVDGFLTMLKQLSNIIILNHQYQVVDLNIARGIPSPETNSFKHAITVVEDDRGNKYLIDLTFSQFINKETGIIQHPYLKSIPILRLTIQLPEKFLKKVILN